MAHNPVDIGESPNDGTGDLLRDAFNKLNNNDAELYTTKLTADEKAAAAGTAGSPSTTNKFVTNEDTRNSDSRSPTGSAGGDLAGSSYPNPTVKAKAIDLAKMADMPQNTIFGRNSTGSGSPEYLTAPQVKNILGLGNYIPITQASHGFVVGNVLTLSGAGVLVKVSDPSTEKRIGIVTTVTDANNYHLTLSGYVETLTGLVAGSIYYAQADGTMSTVETDMPVLQADSTTSGYILVAGAGGGGAESVLSTEYFDGDGIETVFTIPEAEDLKIINVYVGGQLLREGVHYTKDDTAKTVTTLGTVPSGIGIDVLFVKNLGEISALGNWDEGTWGLARIATLAETTAGIDDTRGITALKLDGWWTNIKTLVQTFAAKITFTSAPRFSSTTASQFLKVDSNKDLESVGSASQAEMITGTDDAKPATSLSVEAKRTVKSASISNAATGATNHDCGLKQEVKLVYNTTVTGNISITRSNDSNLEFLHLIIPITGSSITITFPSDVRMARYNESGTVWNQSTKVLTVSSIGTADLHEISLTRAGSIFILRYDGPVRA
jgi:hypothetical protein